MIIRLLFFLLLSVHYCVAQPQLKYSTGTSTAFSATRLNRIDKVVQQYMDSGWIKGAVGFIAYDGNIVYHKAFGTDGEQPMKRDAIFRIASQTKAITSVAAMMLYEEGKFLLDDPLSKYIPEFSNMQVLDTFNDKDSTYTTKPAKRDIIIRDLFTHMAGFAYPNDGLPGLKAIYIKEDIQSGFVADTTLVLGNLMKKLAKLPLAHSPGERFTYGLSVDVLGYLVEVLSGMTLDNFFHQRIFEPLGMKDTWFYLPASRRNRLVQLNTEDKGQVVPWKFAGGKNELNYTYPTVNGKYYAGGAGLSSTIYDYSVFMQMLLNGGIYNGHRILSKRSIEMMTANQIGDLTVGQYDKFGLGFELVTDKEQAHSGRSAGSFLWGGYFGTSYWIDPQKKLVCQLFLQQVPISHGEIHNKFVSLVYQALEK